jgi:hypothetical protein
VMLNKNSFFGDKTDEAWSWPITSTERLE